MDCVRRRPVRLLAAGVLTVLIGSSCGGGDPSASAMGAPNRGDRITSIEIGGEFEPEPLLNGYETLLAATRDASGPGAALELFAAVYGEVGSTLPPEVEVDPPASGTLTVVKILERWDELGVAERADVLERLDLTEADVDAMRGRPPSTSSESEESVDPTSTTADSKADPGEPGEFDKDALDKDALDKDALDKDALDKEALDAGSTEKGDGVDPSMPDHRVVLAASVVRTDRLPYDRALRRASDLMRGHIGRLGRPVALELTDASVGDDGRPPPFADTTIIASGACRIRVFTQRVPPPATWSTTIAHELFHCYQMTWHPRSLVGALEWVVEGSAEWVGASLAAEAGAPSDDTSTLWFGNWLRRPTRSLNERAYDAWPMFALIQEVRPGLWGRLRATVQASDTPSAVRAALGADPDAAFLAEWATAQTGRREFGAPWFVAGPGVPEFRRRGEADAPRLANGGAAQVAAIPYATNRVARSVRSEILRIEGSAGVAGTVRIDGSDRPVAELIGQSWCTDAGGNCVCPPGTRRAGEAIPRLPVDQLYVAVAGGSAGASVDLIGRSLREECGEGGLCPVGDWVQPTASPISGITIISGGTGATLNVGADGSMVQSFDSFVPIQAQADPRGSGLTALAVKVYLAPKGFMTARIAIPPPGTPFTEAVVQSADGSGLTGSGYSEVNGARIDYTVEELRMFVGGVVANSSALGGPATSVPVKVRCDGDDRLVLFVDAGAEQVWTRAPI